MFQGIVQVTGIHDTGKTRFAFECGADPKRIMLVDDDIKTRRVAEQIEKKYGFGRYVDFVEETKNCKSLLEIHKIGMSIVDSVKPDQFDVVIWDTWSRMASTFKPYVQSNHLQFRAANEWTGTGPMIGGTEWKEAFYYEAKVLARLEQLAGLVILVTHLKDHYGPGGQKTGKRIPDSFRTLDRIPRLRLFLIHSASGPVPSALVLKRLSEDRKVPGKGLRTINILPRKIVPSDDHESLWDTIEEYIANPIGRRKPTADETPNADEIAILDGTLTRAQDVTLKLALKIRAHEIEEEAEATEFTERQAKASEVRALAEKGMSRGKIAKKAGLTVREVREILR